MADRQTVSALDAHQIANTGPAGTPTSPVPPGPSAPPILAEMDPLNAPQPGPEGTNPAFERGNTSGATAKGDQAPGVMGEETVWEGRYSLKNFIGRLTLGILLTLGWITLAIYDREMGRPGARFFTIVLGIILGVLWIGLIYRIVRARYSHDYRLTNRRLFVSTGLMLRRRDQMELLHAKDVFIRQTLVERWLSLGTVVVVSKEAELPTLYLAGVEEPNRVMDLVWHHARLERESKAVQVNNL